MKKAVLLIAIFLAACGGGDPVCTEWVHVMPAAGNNEGPKLECANWE